MLPIVILPPAEKYFKKLKDKQLKKEFFEAINIIRKNPYIGSEKKGDLAGIRCYDVKYAGINYELAYRLSVNEQGDMVVVIMAGPRENFYKLLKNYIK